MPKAVYHNTATSFITRRGIALGAGAAAAVGITAGAAATVPTLAPDPDAELIRLSGIVVAGHAEMDRYSELYNGSEPPDIEARIRFLVDQGHELSEQLADMPATTMEGLRAKASVMLVYTMHAWDGDLIWTNHDELLAWSIAQDLLGRA